MFELFESYIESEGKKIVMVTPPSVKSFGELGGVAHWRSPTFWQVVCLTEISIAGVAGFFPCEGDE